MTTSVYIVEEGRFLFIYHPKFQKWLPPGGHIEDNETAPEAARREVREEAGLEIEFLMQDDPIETPYSRSIERPFLVLLQDIPAFGQTPEHQHIDSVFVAKPDRTQQESSPSHICKWFSLEEIEALENDKEVFPDIKIVSRNLTQYISQGQLVTRD